MKEWVMLRKIIKEINNAIATLFLKNGIQSNEKQTHQ